MFVSQQANKKKNLLSLYVSWANCESQPKGFTRASLYYFSAKAVFT